MTMPIHPCPKRALIPLKFEVIFNYDTFFKVAQSYPHGRKLAQLTVPLVRIRSAQLTQNHNQIGYVRYPRRAVASFPVERSPEVI